MTSAVKQAVAEIAASLPEDATKDDAMYRLYVRQKIEEGLEDAARPDDPARAGVSRSGFRRRNSR